MRRVRSGFGQACFYVFVACFLEKRPPAGDINVGAIAALTTIMGRESIYKGRSVTWKELGVTV